MNISFLFCIISGSKNFMLDEIIKHVMRNYLSFSLWGDQPTYTIGAIRNAELAPHIYPGWQMVMYHDQTVPPEILNRLQQLNVILNDMTGSPVYSLFWRFLAADDPDCAYAIFRDTDSRISQRERKAVDEWMASGHIVHVMRDHPAHRIPYGAQSLGILGGMWGIKGGAVNMTRIIEAFIAEKPDQYGVDQDFLQQIYSRFCDSLMVHDEFFDGRSFPEKRVGYQFIGERIDEHEQHIGEDRNALKQYLGRQRTSWMKRLKKSFFK